MPSRGADRVPQAIYRLDRRLFGIEDQACAGDARFSFLQLGQVDSFHLKTSLLEQCAGLRKRSRNDHDIFDQQRVRGAPLVIWNIDQFEFAKLLCI